MFFTKIPSCLQVSNSFKSNCWRLSAVHANGNKYISLSNVALFTNPSKMMSKVKLIMSRRHHSNSANIAYFSITREWLIVWMWWWVWVTWMCRKKLFSFIFVHTKKITHLEMNQGMEEFYILFIKRIKKSSWTCVMNYFVAIIIILLPIVVIIIISLSCIQQKVQFLLLLRPWNFLSLFFIHILWYCLVSIEFCHCIEIICWTLTC